MKPRRIPNEARIGVFTPSEPLTDERLSKVNAGANLLKKHGHTVTFAHNFRARDAYMAGSVQERTHDMHSLLRDGQVDVLMASWGGKSSCQLLPYLDYDLFASARKPVCAFSDGGVLLNAITARTDLVTFYGPNVVGKLDESQYSDLTPIRTGGYGEGSLILDGGVPGQAIVEGVAEGRLFGGNLSTFAINVIGTNYSPDLAGALLFWESSPKKAQEFDSLLQALKLSGVLDAISGMIIGHAEVSTDDRWGHRELDELVVSVLGDRLFPVLHSPSFGHAALPNPMFPIGSLARLDTLQGTLTLLEDALGD